MVGAGIGAMPGVLLTFGDIGSDVHGDGPNPAAVSAIGAICGPGTVPRTEAPPHARAGQLGRGHRLAAHPRWSASRGVRGRVII
jgi:hypothetical protein